MAPDDQSPIRHYGVSVPGTIKDQSGASTDYYSVLQDQCDKALAHFRGYEPEFPDKDPSAMIQDLFDE